MNQDSRPIQASSQSERLIWDEAEVERLISVLDDSSAPIPPPGELSIVFLDDAEMIELHERFFNDPTPTDVITFPGDPEDPDGFAGEICISVETAAERCAEEGQTFAEELTLYIVHGWLHLAGFGDKSDETRALMRLKEHEKMAVARDSGALPSFSLKL